MFLVAKDKTRRWLGVICVFRTLSQVDGRADVGLRGRWDGAGRLFGHQVRTPGGWTRCGWDGLGDPVHSGCFPVIPPLSPNHRMLPPSTFLLPFRIAGTEFRGTLSLSLCGCGDSPVQTK